MYTRAIQEHSGARNQPNLFSQQIFELGYASALYHIGYARYEQTIKKQGSYQEASIAPKVHAGQLFGQKPHEAIYAVDTQGAQRKKFNSTKRSMAALFVSTRSPRNTPRTSSTSRIEQIRKAKIHGSVAHIPSTRTPVATSWSQTRSTSYAKAFEKKPYWRKLFARQKFHAKSGNSLPQRKKIGNARRRCFVVLSGQNETAIEFLQLKKTHGAATKKSVESAMARSFVFFKMAQNITLNMSEKHTECWQSCPRLAHAKKPMNKDSGFVNYQIHRQAVATPNQRKWKRRF